MKYKQTFKEALKQVREDGHTDVASAVRQCKTTIEDASQMLSKLQGMNPENDLPSWWMNKIAIAANSMNKLRDYLLVPSTNEQKEEPKNDDNKVANLKTKLAKEKDTDALEKQNITLQGQVELLKQKLENEKNKAIKPEPNPDTGEIPLTVGVAYKALRDKMKKEEKMNEARWEVEGRISYRGISSEDDFHMVIDAPSEKAAEAKVEKELEKARDRRKIGPGGGGNIEDFDIEHLERTTDRLSAPQTTYRNSYDPTQKEDKQPDIVDDKETKKEKSKGKALTGSPKTVVDTDPKVDYKN